MDWTSLYLKTFDFNVFILGTGEVATRRANKFLDHGANVKLVGDSLPKELKYKGASLCSVSDIEDIVVNFDDGLNIMTGETGAGKSLIIGSINAVTR